YEAAWRHAVLLTIFVLPTKKRRATTQAKAWLLWDDTNLYLAAEMEDKDIYGYHKGHDPDFGCDDILELFLRPSRNKPPYWEFHVTPTGATRDYFYPRRFYGSDEDSLAYESGMTAAVVVEGSLENWEDRDTKWTAEVAIPLTALENTIKARPTSGSNWTFLVSRYDYSVYLKGGVELSTAFPLEQLNFHWLEDYGTLHFE
ncbi:MAG: carbohydrate-binding family 9-like protein, partial [Armatimonadetes bacterium]|nr:carbohydrate-binding family 9-like protein [Armatimonadota bacterium]